MKKILPVCLVLAAGLFLMFPTPALADPGDKREAPAARIGDKWATGLDPWRWIPPDLAIEVANSAQTVGMTRSQVLWLLNHELFAMAIGSPDQGYSALRAMARDPESIKTAYDMLRVEGAYPAPSGATDFQNELFVSVPQLRNAYLSDLGLRVVMGALGYEVLIDVGTGRQFLGDGILGIQLRAPGGGPLNVPAPEDVAAAMWAAVGLAPDGVTPLNGAAETGASSSGAERRSAEQGGRSIPTYLYLGVALLLLVVMGRFVATRGSRRLRIG